MLRLVSPSHRRCLAGIMDPCQHVPYLVGLSRPSSLGSIVSEEPFGRRSIRWRRPTEEISNMQMKLQIGRQGMRRVCALFLLLLSVGPWLLALSPFHASAEALLPTCCRSHGRHMCFKRLSAEGRTASSSGATAVSQVSERCTYNLAWTYTIHNAPFGQPAEDVRWMGHSSRFSSRHRNQVLHFFLIARELQARPAVSSPFAQSHDR